MKRKAMEGWTDKDKAENVDFLKRAVNLSSWGTNTQMCSQSRSSWCLCQLITQVHELQPPEQLRKAAALRSGASDSDHGSFYGPISVWRPSSDTWRVLTAAAKSRISSLLWFLRVFTDFSQSKKNELWWPVMEGACDSGGHYKSYPPTTLRLLFLLSLLSLISLFSLGVIHGPFRLLVWNYIVRRSKRQGFDFLIGTERRGVACSHGAPVCTEVRSLGPVCWWSVSSDKFLVPSLISWSVVFRQHFTQIWTLLQRSLIFNNMFTFHSIPCFVFLDFWG